MTFGVGGRRRAAMLRGLPTGPADEAARPRDHPGAARAAARPRASRRRAAPRARPPRPSPHRPGWPRATSTRRSCCKAQAPFQPEQAVVLRRPRLRRPGRRPRPGQRQALPRRDRQGRAPQLQAKLQGERDPNVRQDLQILIQAADDAIEASEVNERLTQPWVDVAADWCSRACRACCPTRPRPSAARRRSSACSATPAWSTARHRRSRRCARQRYEERAGDAALLQPTQDRGRAVAGELADLRQGPARAVRQVPDRRRHARARRDREAAQRLRRHGRATKVLPNSAHRLHSCRPSCTRCSSSRSASTSTRALLIERAQVGFMETRAAMQQLAPLVAKEKGLKATDYRRA